MNENIDLTKILKDCPKGTKFYSALHGEVTFNNSNEDLVNFRNNYNNFTTSFYKDGRHFKGRGECVLFPSKEQRDWSKFVPTWKQEKQKVKVTIHPFDRMLYRHTAEMKWSGTIIANYDKMYTSSEYIPYNKDTAHLLGTNDDCPIEYEIEFSKEYKE
jgi:hypothetical protein